MSAHKGNSYAAGNPGGGRPSIYKNEFSKLAYKICLLGATDQELANIFEVSEVTINNWKNDHKEFSLALKKGKVLADAEVVNKLYTRANGYSYDEVTFEKVDNKVNLEVASNGEIKTDDAYKKKIVTKEVIPDTTAQIFWLKNRQPEKWREKNESINKNFNYNSAEMPPEEVRKYNDILESEV